MSRLATTALVVLALGAGCASKKPIGTAGSGNTTAASPAVTQGRGAGPEAAARMTAEQLQAAMKTIGTNNGTLGTKLMAGDLAGAAKDAQTLATAFADVERFFAQTSKADAVGWAKQARMSASEVAATATANDVTKATAARTTLTGQCRQCHTAYREGDAQTGYRLKAGVI
jgi:hypothetical protein